MKERPILFSAPMVRAILVGRKTQTRRVVALSNSTVLGRHDRQMWDRLVWDDGANPVSIDPGPDPFGSGDYEYLHVPFMEDGEGLRARVRPRVKAGDRLWVRETWAATCALDEDKPTDLSPDHDYWYRADDPSDDRIGRWRPSIHMPRWASRIDLLVTGVRVQKLQDISEEDAKAEGLRGPKPYTTGARIDLASAQLRFADLWESINGIGSWYSNPWVWVVDFRPVSERREGRATG